MKSQYSHESLDGWDKEKVADTTVFLAGLGATGSQTALSLARIGIGKAIVLDQDVLEERNIGNQVYYKSQMGKTKVDAIEDLIKKIGDMKVEKIHEPIEECFNRQIDADIFLGNFDNHGARYCLNYIANQRKKPLIDVGIENLTGSLRFIIPGKTPCLDCWTDLLVTPKRKVGCSREKIPTPYYVASVVSSMQINEMLNYLFGRKIHAMTYFDLQKAIATPVELSINEMCKLCGTKYWKMD